MHPNILEFCLFAQISAVNDSVLPVSAGLGVRRDVRGVQEFLSLISGSKVKFESGFVDLTSLGIVAEYKFHSKNMTAMGLQTIGPSSRRSFWR